MKVLKTILIIVAIVLILGLIIALFLPQKVVIKKTILIKAPVETIFNQVNSHQKALAWSPWKDTLLEKKFEGPECGVGCKQIWNFEKKCLSSLTIIESTPNSFIKQELKAGEKKKSYAIWNFEETQESVLVLFEFELRESRCPYSRYIWVFHHKPILEKKIIESLENLKNYVESLPVEPEKNWSISEVEVKDFEKQFVLTIKDSSLMHEMKVKMDGMFDKLYSYIKENNIEILGPPYSKWFSYNMEGLSAFEVGVPVPEATSGMDNIVYKESYTGNVTTLIHTGPYEASEHAWNTLQEYVKTNELKSTGEPWETYIVGPKNEEDPTKFITQVFFPVE